MRNLLIETRLASVPALLRVPPKITQPPIVLWHGFGPPASERALMEALPLDDVPALKVYLGLPQFGAREAPNGREDMVRRQAEDLGRLVFEPVVVGAAEELPDVVTALQQQQCLRALLILHGKDDAMLTSQNVVALLVDGLSHGWADSAHVGELRQSIAQWFNERS